MHISKTSFFGILFLLLGGLQVSAQQTTFWVVRHAEKDTAAATKSDPPLSAIGEQRVKDLHNYLLAEKIDNVFSTDTKRTRATAAAVDAPLLIYGTRNFADFANILMPEFKGKKVLIVGHSNTVLETLEALGAKRPVKELKDDDYDYIFTLTIDDAGKVKVDVAHYGAIHRN